MKPRIKKKWYTTFSAFESDCARQRRRAAAIAADAALLEAYEQQRQPSNPGNSKDEFWELVSFQLTQRQDPVERLHGACRARWFRLMQ